MSIIHRTTLKPTKLELLTDWLPSRPWYRGGSAVPELSKAGGFRLDDPEGEVGMEFMVVTDGSDEGDGAVSYFVPLTYRGAPLEGAEQALVGTLEHGVLGKRWVYDGPHDPVLTAELIALIEGRAQAQAQSENDALDREVARSYVGHGSVDLAGASVAEGDEGTELRTARGATLRLHRVLRPGPDELPRGASGHVAGAWQLSDGSRVRGLVAELRGTSTEPAA
ncbi:maltokinase N-terminal cap-like domain-containing protein [Streptomyces sp. NPDC002851]